MLGAHEEFNIMRAAKGSLAKTWLDEALSLGAHKAPSADLTTPCPRQVV